MEKRRKSGTAHYFFLVYIIMRRESVMLGSALLLSYRNNGKNRNIKVNEQCRKEKWVQFSLSLSGHGF